jgi:hypothetical protein
MNYSNYNFETDSITKNLLNVKTKKMGKTPKFSSEYDEELFSIIRLILSSRIKIDEDGIPDEDDFKVFLSNYMNIHGKLFDSDVKKEADGDYYLKFLKIYEKVMSNVHKFVDMIDDTYSLHWEYKLTNFFTFSTRKYVVLIQCSREQFDKKKFMDLAFYSYLGKKDGKFPTQSQIILFNPVTNVYVKKSMKMISKIIESSNECLNVLETMKKELKNKK